MALAWALAWPLTHLGMLAQSGLHTYIGMSGVLHAGLSIWCIHQITPKNTPRFKAMGWLVFSGLSIKILMENPLTLTLIHAPGSDITVAPWAHFSGLMAGLLTTTLVLACESRGAAKSSRQPKVHSTERPDEIPGNFKGEP